MWADPGAVSQCGHQPGLGALPGHQSGGLTGVGCVYAYLYIQYPYVHYKENVRCAYSEGQDPTDL